MSRWIDADAVKSIIRSGVSTDTEADKDYVCERIDEAPTIDIVRCKDCKWWWKEWETCTHNNLVDGYTCATTFKADSFCSYGERRER